MIEASVMKELIVRFSVTSAKHDKGAELIFSLISYCTIIKYGDSLTAIALYSDT